MEERSDLGEVVHRPCRLAPRLRAPEAPIAVLTDPLDLVGSARRQVHAIARRIDEVVSAHPDDAAYQPEPIL